MIAHLLAAALAAVSHYGDGTDTALSRPNPDATRVVVSNSGIFALQWRQPVVRTGLYRRVVESFGQPALSARHGLVIVGSGEGQVIAMAWADGREVWRYDHGTSFETGATIVHVAGGEMALLGSRDGTLLALEVASGKLIWRANIEGDMRAPPLQSGSKLVVTTAANKVLVLDAAQGHVLWAQGRPASTALTVEGHARAAVHGEFVYATFSDGYVSAMDLEHGTVAWSRPLSLKGGGFIDADADPFVAGGHLFVASYSDGIYALDPVDGQTLWNRAALGVTSLLRYEDTVVAGSAEGYVWSLQQHDGAPRFRTKVAQGPISRMLAVGKLIVFTAGPSGLVVLNGQTGRPLQATPFGGRAAGDPVAAGSDLAFLTSSGYVYAWAQQAAPERAP